MKFFEYILNQMPGSSGTYANFYQVAYPVYIVSRLFGFLPFTIEYSAKTKIQKIFVTLKDLVRFFLALIILAFCVYAGFLDKTLLKHNSKALIQGTRLVIFVGLILAAFSMIMDLVNRKLLGIVLMEVREIDEQVHTI